MNAYRQRIFALVRSLLRPYAPLPQALDFGSGDGWFAQQVCREGLVREIAAVDVQRRSHCLTEPLLYDGQRLPFADQTFELTYAIDVLHHCPDPAVSLRELLRCTRRLLLLKDHTYRSRAGWLTLCLLDEVGNRRVGVPSPYKYQHHWDWLPLITAAGFVQEQLIHPAACHTGALGWATNHLQFVALWRRESA